MVVDSKLTHKDARILFSFFSRDVVQATTHNRSSLARWSGRGVCRSSRDRCLLGALPGVVASLATGVASESRWSR